MSEEAKPLYEQLSRQLTREIQNDLYRLEQVRNRIVKISAEYGGTGENLLRAVLDLLLECQWIESSAQKIRKDFYNAIRQFDDADCRTLCEAFDILNRDSYSGVILRATSAEFSI